MSYFASHHQSINPFGCGRDYAEITAPLVPLTSEPPSPSSAPTARLHTSLGKRIERCPRYRIEKEKRGLKARVIFCLASPIHKSIWVRPGLRGDYSAACPADL